jgi:excisionase family DNA binding protein
MRLEASMDEALLQAVNEKLHLDKLLTISEAADELRVSRATVAAWLSQSRMDRTKVGAATRIRRRELAKVCVEGGKSPAPPRKIASPRATPPDAAMDASRETSEPPEADKPAIPQPPPRRLYQPRKKLAPAKIA